MNNRHYLIIQGLLICLFLLSPYTAFAQDVEGSKDHPMIKRYPGSVIREYEQKEFDEYELVLGPVKGGKFQKTQSHIAIYGILFDFNKADVKPESEPAIKEIAKLLKQDSKLKLHVRGSYG